MQLKPEEISKVIRSQIKYYENAIQQNETGTILMVGDGIARASWNLKTEISAWHRTLKKTVFLS